MYLMQSILVESLLCCNLPEGAFYMLVRLAQPSRNVLVADKLAAVVIGRRGQISS